MATIPTRKRKRKHEFAHENARDMLTIDFFTALTIEQCEDRLKNARKPRFVPGEQTVDVHDRGQFTITIWTGLNPLPLADKDQHGIPLKFHGVLQIEDGKTRVRGHINEKYLKYLHDPVTPPLRFNTTWDMIIVGSVALYALIALLNLDNAGGGIMIIIALMAVFCYLVKRMKQRRVRRWLQAYPGQFATWIEDYLYTPY